MVPDFFISKLNIFNKNTHMHTLSLLCSSFRMAYSDFVQQYSKLEICNLTPDTLTSEGVARWSYHQFEGTWKVGSTAGGCRNNPGSYSYYYIA